MAATAFTPVSALAGGALIGSAATLLWWANGRIAGVSGIAGRLGGAAAGWWRWAFVAGLVLGAGAFAAAGGTVAPARLGVAPVLLLAAGALVGYGSALGNGCTSGHGVCGIARRSPRSLVGTLVFLVVALLVTGLARHVLGWLP